MLVNDATPDATVDTHLEIIKTRGLGHRNQNVEGADKRDEEKDLLLMTHVLCPSVL